MSEMIKTFTKSIFRGIDGIQLNKRSDYSQYVPDSARQMSERTWLRLGSNLRNAMIKVVEENEKV